MKKELPTLADEVVRATFELPKLIKPEVRRLMHQAHRIVLSEDMSAFLADLGWRAYKQKPERASEIMEQVRLLARLPFPVTWIEWNETALARRAKAEYASDMNPDLVPVKTGWLLMRHPGIETAFCVINFGVGRTNFGSEGQLSLGAVPFAFVWSTDDTPLPYKKHPLIEDEQVRLVPMSAILTGLTSYRSPQLSITEVPDLIDPVETHVEAKRILGEATGMMRYLLGFLAAFNDLPISSREVTSSKGYLTKGNYRKFLEHKMLTLTIPSTEYRTLANKVVTGLRRRAHPVRGHWRDHHAFPPNITCEHDWQPDKNNIRCSRCHGKQIWIADHIRGDTSLGFVTHSYRVETAAEKENT